jgi:enediyne biosynthesis protein E4
VFALSEVGRGAAFGDVDNDGDVDILIGNNNGPTRLLINQVVNGHHWIGLRLVGVGGRDMLGARIEVIQAGASTRWRRARSDGSYASANDSRIIVGLGESATPPDVRVTWPDGKVDTWTRVAVDRYTTLKQR